MPLLEKIAIGFIISVIVGVYLSRYIIPKKMNELFSWFKRKKDLK